MAAFVPNQPCSEHIIESIADLLEQVCEANDEAFDNEASTSVFQSETIPTISVADYLNRIVTVSKCSEQAVVTALVLINRLIVDYDEKMFNSWTVHRLLFTAVMTGAKVTDDMAYNNKGFSQIGGLSKAETFSLECDFLMKLNWNTIVDTEEYDSFLEHLNEEEEDIVYNEEEEDIAFIE